MVVCSGWVDAAGNIGRSLSRGVDLDVQREEQVGRISRSLICTEVLTVKI